MFRRLRLDLLYGSLRLLKSPLLPSWTWNSFSGLSNCFVASSNFVFPFPYCFLVHFYEDDLAFIRKKQLDLGNFSKKKQKKVSDIKRPEDFVLEFRAKIMLRRLLVEETGTSSILAGWTPRGLKPCKEQALRGSKRWIWPSRRRSG